MSYSHPCQPYMTLQNLSDSVTFSRGQTLALCLFIHYSAILTGVWAEFNRVGFAAITPLLVEVRCLCQEVRPVFHQVVIQTYVSSGQ
jgi:hypothetical protein